MKSPLSHTEPSKEGLGLGSSLALGSLGGFRRSINTQSCDEDPGEEIVEVLVCVCVCVCVNVCVFVCVCVCVCVYVYMV